MRALLQNISILRKGALGFLLFLCFVLATANAATAANLPLCDNDYMESMADTEEMQKLKADFREKKKKFSELCDQLKEQGLDLERHKKDGFFLRLFGFKENFDDYQKRHEQQIAKLPKDLRDEFETAQKGLQDAYSKMYTAAVYVNKEVDKNFEVLNKAMSQAAASPALGSNIVTSNSAFDQVVANNYKAGRLNDEDLKQLESTGDFNPNAVISDVKLSNESCRVEQMEKKYQSSCYSCLVIKTILEKFIDACTRVNDLCREAAVKVLLIATLIWAAFWTFRTISSLSSLEPASLVQTLLVQFFKILFAYVVIESGMDTFLIYVVTPILTAGADFGKALLDSTNELLSLTPTSEYTYSGVKYLSADMLNKIMGFTESLDRVTSTNLVIGHALTCHSTHAGAWVNKTIFGFSIVVPNIWIWICGALIWFSGFMMTLSIGYYLLDISFKIGIAILVFPVTMALWPFSWTKSKVAACIKTMLTSAGTFAFLAITTSYAVVLISKSLRNIVELKKRIAAGDVRWINDTFDITGPYFILLLFAYFYSLKLIGSNATYVGKFFGGGLLSGASPMHSNMTMMTDIAKKSAVGLTKVVTSPVQRAAGRAMDKVADATLGAASRYVGRKAGQAGRGFKRFTGRAANATRRFFTGSGGSSGNGASNGGKPGLFRRIGNLFRRRK